MPPLGGTHSVGEASIEGGTVAQVGALAGVRIIDLSWGIAGPLGVMLLAEQGADAIKVEPPGGDPFRGEAGSPVWHRSRRSIVVDLKRIEGREVIERLCQDTDVLVETFRPGTMERLGLSYRDLRERFPRLVYCSCPAYPTDHRFAARPGWDALVQARLGLQHEQPGWRPGPTFLHFPAPSMAAGLLLAGGVLAALVDREDTGTGQHVQTSLYQGGLAFTTQIWSDADNLSAFDHSMMGKSYPPGVHQVSIYECADGEWIHAATMSGRTPTRSQDDILGLEPIDFLAALSMSPDERAAREELVRQAFLRRSRDDLVAEFHAAGLGAEAIVPSAEFLHHPQLEANEMVISVEDPDLGATRQIGVPIQLEATPGSLQGPRPSPGQHSRQVLEEVGYDHAVIDGLISSGVVEAR